MKSRYFQVAVALLAISFFSAAAPANNRKKSIFSRSRWDRRTEETTTIRVYQPKYKTLFNFRQQPTTSTNPPILPEVIDNYSSSPTSVNQNAHHPLLVEELSVELLFSTAATESSANSFSDSSNFSPESSNSASPSSPSLNSTTESSKPFSMFSMPNLLRPPNSMTNFFKSFSRSPKLSASPSSTLKPNDLSNLELPSSIMKPPSIGTLSPSTIRPLTSSTSSSSFSSTPQSVPSLSASFFSSSSPQVHKTYVSQGISASSSGFSHPRGTAVIVAASNPSSDASLGRIPKSSSASVHAVASDSSVNGDYSFSYRVNDSSTHQDFGHRENRVGSNTQGRYDVVLPDGRRQVVDYQVLSDSGYVADVSYVGDIKPSEAPIIQSTTTEPLLLTNAKIEENMEFPI